MSKQPLGKTLLRNVIRHTDAHNKIQEETEMWKMRGWEIQMSDHKQNTDTGRGRMHCDRVPDQSRNMSAGRERVSEHDDRDARYWTRKLYEFEATDPDRWGHSGFKELYPEEFDSDSDSSATIKKTGHRKVKKSKSDTEACLSKRSKKSSRKKKKKKKAKDGKRKKDNSSSSDSGTDDRSDTKDKRRKKKRTKSQRKDKSVKTQRDEDRNSGDSRSHEKKEGRTNGRKKRKRDCLKDSDSGLDSKKKRRKNWRAAGEESSGGSSTD